LHRTRVVRSDDFSGRPKIFPAKVQAGFADLSGERVF